MALIALQKMSVQTIDAFKQTVETTSTLNKNVMAVALIALGLLAALWFGYRSYLHVEKPNALTEQLQDVLDAKAKIEADFEELQVKYDDMQAELIKLQHSKYGIDLRDNLLAINKDDDASIQKGISAFEKFARCKFILTKSYKLVQFESDFQDCEAQIRKVEDYSDKKETNAVAAIAELSKKRDKLLFDMPHVDLQIEMAKGHTIVGSMTSQTDDEMIAIAEMYLSLHVNFAEMNKSFRKISSKIDAIMKS
jgi:hypothetical protein